MRHNTEYHEKKKWDRDMFKIWITKSEEILYFSFLKKLFYFQKFNIARKIGIFLKQTSS